MTESRDVVVIETAKVQWTEGKAVGFLPWTLFYEEETANKGYKAPVSFFQDFGFREQPWRSIDEHALPEATPADIYHYGWWGNPNVDWTVLEKQRSAPAARLTLVPDWTSYIGPEQAAALEEARLQRRRAKELQERIRSACAECRRKEPLFYSNGYVHRADIGHFTWCPAEDLHYDADTEVPLAPRPSDEALAEYRVLRGYLQEYGRTNSSKTIIRSHSAYRKLVELGRDMAPFIIDDIREGQIGGIWTAEVLADLTGKNNDWAWWQAWAIQQKKEEESQGS